MRGGAVRHISATSSGASPYAPQIPQHLGGRDALLAPARLLAIENPVPALGLDDAEAVLKPLPRRKRCSFRLRLGACKKQRIRHVVPRLGREVLLDRHLVPAKRFEKGPYELLLGLRLSRIVQLRECSEPRVASTPEAGYVRITESGPSRRSADPLKQKIAREQAAVEQGSS